MLRKSSILLVAAGLAIGWSAPETLAAGVGKVFLIKEWAYERLMPRDWEDLFMEEEVFSNQAIRTPPDGAVHVHLVDGADFRVGANSEVVIDKFVYDPDKGTGQLVTTLGKGAFRFISGKVKDYEIKTPSATVGIRGTDIIIAVLPNNDTVMQVNKGAAEMTPCSTGPDQRFECNPGAMTILAVGETGGVVFGADRVEKGVDVPYEAGLDDGAGLASLNPQGGGPNRFDTGFGNNEFNENTTLDRRLIRGTIEETEVTSPVDQPPSLPDDGPIYEIPD